MAFRSLCTATHAYSCSVVYSSNVCVWCTVCTVLYRNTVQHNFLEFYLAVTSVQFVLFALLYSTNVHWCTNKPVFTTTAVTLQVGHSIFKILLGRRMTIIVNSRGACFALPEHIIIWDSVTLVHLCFITKPSCYPAEIFLQITTLLLYSSDKLFQPWLSTLLTKESDKTKMQNSL